ncbi:MAG: acyltransferase [Desulfobacterales bacterium]|nr:acyltransferase [Desulfobacterales bacterium]
MKISFLDILLASSAIVATVGITWLLLVITSSTLTGCLPLEFAGIAKIALFVLLLFLVTGLLLRLVRMICPMKEGSFPLDKSKEGASWKLQGFLYIFNLGLFMNSYLIPVNLRGLLYSFLGARIGKWVMIGGKILEPPLVEIGDYSQLGEDVLLTAHTVERGMVTLGKIRIGRHVTVGVKTVIFPGVEIGDYAIIAAGSVVTKNTKVPMNEVWGGIPARKLK